MKKLVKEEHRKEQNRRYKTLIKNDKKRILLAVASKSNTEEVFKLFKKAQSNLDKSVTKKIIHRNNAARKKSSLSRILNSVG